MKLAMAVGDQRAELPGRDVDLPLPQLLKQERLRNMRMVVLVQDESAELRAEAVSYTHLDVYKRQIR